MKPSQLLISIGAGLAAAVFFIVPIKGAMAAGLAMLFAPLPLMIAGLSFAPSSAAAGTVAGALLVYALVHEYYAVFFLVWAGVPAFWLTRLAWLGRPAEAGETGDENGVVWYPIGDLLFWAAILGIAVALAMLATASYFMGGYDAFHAQLTKDMTPVVESALKLPSAPKLPESAKPQDIASHTVFMIPAAIAASATLSYAWNLWIAARIAMISQRLRRAWSDVPETLRLPRYALLGLLLAFMTAALAPGLFRALALVVIAAFAAAYMLHGYAVLHHHSRHLQARNALLSALYLTTIFFFPAPLFAAAALGIAHGALVRPARPNNSSQT